MRDNLQKFNLVTSLYIHYPFCRHLCNYCDFYKTISQDNSKKEYHTLLDEMWKTHENFLENQNYSFGKLQSLYIGGGTPSLWGSEGIAYLEDRFERWKISFEKDYEFTLEVNPGSWTEPVIKGWKDLGVNRFSLGIQSLRDDYLKTLDRVHSTSDVHKTLKFFNEINANFSVDFMLGLPLSVKNHRDIIAELEEILEYDPAHLSLYILTPKSGYPLKSTLPKDDFLSAEYLRVVDFLASRNIHQYEVSNFAVKGKESLHNLQYWKCYSVAALGPSGVGYLSKKNLRYKWKVSSPEMVFENLKPDSIDLERLYMGLRLNEGIEINDHFSSEELPNLILLFQRWENEGLAELRDGKLALKASGLIILDSLIGQIFAETT